MSSTGPMAVPECDHTVGERRDFNGLLTIALVLPLSRWPPFCGNLAPMKLAPGPVWKLANNMGEGEVDIKK